MEDGARRTRGFGGDRFENAHARRLPRSRRRGQREAPVRTIARSARLPASARADGSRERSRADDRGERGAHAMSTAVMNGVSRSARQTQWSDVAYATGQAAAAAQRGDPRASRPQAATAARTRSRRPGRSREECGRGHFGCAHAWRRPHALANGNAITPSHSRSSASIVTAETAYVRIVFTGSLSCVRSRRAGRRTCRQRRGGGEKPLVRSAYSANRVARSSSVRAARRRRRARAATVMSSGPAGVTTRRVEEREQARSHQRRRVARSSSDGASTPREPRSSDARRGSWRRA